MQNLAKENIRVLKSSALHNIVKRFLFTVT